MAVNDLLFPVLSFVVLLGVAAFVLRLRRWRRGPAELRGMTSTNLPATRTSSPSADLSETLRDPATWTVGFLLLVAVAVTGALAVVGALPVPEGYQGYVGTGMMLVAALLFGGFLFAGTYSSVRSRGYGSAPATGLGALVVGLIALVIVVVQLFLGGGM